MNYRRHCGRGFRGDEPQTNKHVGSSVTGAVCSKMEMEQEMTTPDVNRKGLRVGVLIIGSLLWDDKESRTEWRQKRLEALDNRTRVRAPIRYGRLSRSRGCTYTMVFSKELDAPDKRGWAFVVPCKARVNGVDDLVTEARLLWQAEEGKKVGRISARWGCVALLLQNPQRRIPDLRAGWTKHVQQEPDYGALNSATGETPVVDDGGFLTISWPKTDGDSDLEGFDALLATATDPTLVRGDYPAAQEIGRRRLAQQTAHAPAMPSAPSAPRPATS